MKIEEINKVCFVGAGTMGCFNALIAAIAGYDAVLYDVSQETLDQVPARQQEISAMLIGYGLCEQTAVTDAFNRISVCADLRAASEGVDLVSESVFEQLDIKRELHKQLDDIFPAHTIITTNTSALPVSAIEDVVGRGELFAALHSHLGSPLIDIVGGPRTTASTIDTLKRYVLSLHAVPLVLKQENPGYVLNAMLGPLLSTAMKLVINGSATKEIVDSAWMQHGKAPMGPFGMMDLFGLNLIFDSWQYKPADPAIDKDKANILHFLRPYIEAGDLGMKTGKGFYQYPHPFYQSEDFCNDEAGVIESYEALIAVLVSHAVLIAQRGILDPQDIDRAWKVGMHLDTGPFAILESIGIQAYLKMLKRQVKAGLCLAENAALVERYLQAEESCYE